MLLVQLVAAQAVVMPVVVVVVAATVVGVGSGGGGYCCHILSSPVYSLRRSLRHPCVNEEEQHEPVA